MLALQQPCAAAAAQPAAARRPLGLGPVASRGFGPVRGDVRATVRPSHCVQAVSVEEAPSTSAPTKVADKTALDVEEWELKSTWEHRGWVAAGFAIQAGLFYQCFNHIGGFWDAFNVVEAAVVAYYMADFGTGIYHWGVDNYGDANTPVFGDQIAGFQGHHQKPWTITHREFANNVHKIFRPSCALTMPLLLLSFWTPAWFDMWAGSMAFYGCMSQQFHAWSHMKKSELPAIVDTMQEKGLLISRKQHGAHHRAPFEGNYCIVSGACNEFLDEILFFRKLEDLVYAQYGVEPRCWYEPNGEWKEMAEPGTA